jgi:hypothetical protein
VVKNRLAPPGSQAVFDLLFNGGVDRLAESLDAARAAGQITPDATGAWRWKGHVLGHTRSEARSWMAARPEAAAAMAGDVWRGAHLSSVIL